MSGATRGREDFLKGGGRTLGREEGPEFMWRGGKCERRGILIERKFVRRGAIGREDRISSVNGEEVSKGGDEVIPEERNTRLGRFTKEERRDVNESRAHTCK